MSDQSDEQVPEEPEGTEAADVDPHSPYRTVDPDEGPTRSIA